MSYNRSTDAIAPVAPVRLPRVPNAAQDYWGSLPELTFRLPVVKCYQPTPRVATGEKMLGASDAKATESKLSSVEYST
ncbi:MAG TPA: hypothetical protein DCE56_21110 [Cyanobacteria bacterium UBA8553]|nr:hypothetical protein [Cyanobacteria bacterium UBA8553]HAJ59869.1 hypothetical protein [Cyanobacteria bacterium UBA8543]